MAHPAIFESATTVEPGVHLVDTDLRVEALSDIMDRRAAMSRTILVLSNACFIGYKNTTLTFMEVAVVRRSVHPEEVVAAWSYHLCKRSRTSRSQPLLRVCWIHKTMK